MLSRAKHPKSGWARSLSFGNDGQGLTNMAVTVTPLLVHIWGQFFTLSLKSAHRGDAGLCSFRRDFFWAINVGVRVITIRHHWFAGRGQCACPGHLVTSVQL